MNHRLLFWSGLLGLGTFFTSCGSHLEAKPPSPKPWSKIPDSPPSMVVVPVELRLSDLTQEFQRRFPDVIAQMNNVGIPSCPTSDCKASFKVTRKGNLLLKANPDGSLNIAMPVHLEGQIGFSQNLGFTTVSKSQNFASDLNLNINNRMSVNPNWSLHSQTAAQAQFSQAVLPINLPMIGTVNLNIQPILEPAVDKLLETQMPAIDRMISEQFSLRPFVEPLWQKMVEPQALGEGLLPTPVWLRAQPSEIYFQNLRAEGDFVRAAVGVKGNFYIDLGEKPQSLSASPLPQIKLSPALNSALELHLPIRLPYADLAKVLNDQLAGKEFNSDGHRVLIKQVDLYGNGDNIIVKLDFKSFTSPKAEGTAYVQATPVFNTQTQKIEVEKVSLTSETNSMLLNGAAWLANNFFESKIKEMLRFDVGAKLTEVRQTATTALKDYRIPQAQNVVSLQGTLTDLRVDTLIPEEKGVQMVLGLKGTLQAKAPSVIH